MDYFAAHHENKNKYSKLYKAYTDSIKPLISKDVDEYLYQQEWELLSEKKFDACLKINASRLAKSKIATKPYSYITFQRSMIYEQMGDRDMEQHYLALSAISDIMASRKDNASLAKLALRVYEDGKTKKATAIYNIPLKMLFFTILNCGSMKLPILFHSLWNRIKKRPLKRIMPYLRLHYQFHYCRLYYSFCFILRTDREKSYKKLKTIFIK